MKRHIQEGSTKLILCVSAIAILIAAVPSYKETMRYVEKISAADFIVIDPGHGGFDGGAESADGVPEKDINLSIAKEIEALALADGWNVVMTRDEDVSLSGEEGSIRSRKTQDLLERKRVISEIKPEVAVSIHLNSFKEDPSVRGAQVFYPKESKDQILGEKSQALAEAVQRSLVLGIDDGTERGVLTKEGVMILKNAPCPIALVECGFLSNPEEAKLLADSEYQKKLAACIYEGILSFTGKEPKPDIRLVVSK